VITFYNKIEERLMGFLKNPDINNHSFAFFFYHLNIEMMLDE